MKQVSFVLLFVLFLYGNLLFAEENNRVPEKEGNYQKYVQECADTLIAYGTDHYGEKHAPILVSILDVETRTCPGEPLALDEDYRVARRERRNPAGANLLTDQPLLGVLFRLSELTGDSKYADAVKAYVEYYLRELVDRKGFFWWGWHRHYDVYKDVMTGHQGNHHEIHEMYPINWEKLWDINPSAVRREIEAIWEWHVIDKQTGEINRHGDKKRGCDFSISAGGHLHAFAFLYAKTGESVWLDRARLIADYYHALRNQETNLFPERPNAGKERFDGSAFVTAITGCHCRSLMMAYTLTQEPAFKEYAFDYLNAYAKYGYDMENGRFWGALNLDGTPILGPRMDDGYAKYEPRGYLELWEPYVAGYQYPLYTAIAYIEAYEISQEPVFLETAKRFSTWILNTPTGSEEGVNTWYGEYSRGMGKEGTYAGKYGMTISFFLHLYNVTKEVSYLENAQMFADETIQKLYYKGLFRGHPAKPYYEAMDGVGFLLDALLELDTVFKLAEEKQESVVFLK